MQHQILGVCTVRFVNCSIHLRGEMDMLSSKVVLVTPKKYQRVERVLDGEKLAKVLVALGRFLLSIAIAAHVIGFV